MTRSRAGTSVALLAIVCTVAALGVVVMALSNRIDSLRARHAQRALSRVGEGLAESAIAECLDDFSATAAARIASTSMVEHLRNAALGGVVPGMRVLAQKSLHYRAERTEELMREDNSPLTLSQVEIVPLYYSLIQNHGEVELTAVAESASDHVYRRVTGRYYTVVDTDGTFRVNALPIRMGVFRSEDQ